MMRMVVVMMRMMLGGVDGGDDRGLDQKKGEDTLLSSGRSVKILFILHQPEPYMLMMMT